MSDQWSFPAAPTEGQREIKEALARAPEAKKLPPRQWLKKNLFNNWFNAVLTIVLGAVSAYLLFRTVRFVFFTGRWEPVRENLELFMIGQFPRDERWRIVGQVLLIAGAIGAAIGALRGASIDRAHDTGEPRVVESWRTYFASYWAVGLFVAVMLSAFVRSAGPWIVAICCLALAVIGYLITGFLPTRLSILRWTIAAVPAVISFQLLSGFSGWAWFFMTVALAPLVRSEVGRLLTDTSASLSWVLAAVGAAVGLYSFAVGGLGIFSFVFTLFGLYGLFQMISGDRIDAGRTGATMVLGLVVFLVYSAIGLDGIDWTDWGGFHISLVATVAAIVLAFPLGMLLALGRRSSLPAVRVMSVAYIEFFRGAPLITFLLSAQFFLGFFLGSDTQLSLITRAIAAITLFSAAYVAEIIRGGLQAVPPGQIEAGQAMGLSQPKIMRLIVMPQALRAVIPAMVGQFISLFKDTTLLSIIAINELLGVRELVHAQADFRGFGIGETLVFVAFGFWAVAFTMSRESQRLERRLGVGER
ncbi:MAG: amino acid ABC transporter permease [Acidimicrobiia bacterium]|nr:amino acid ABC transporter permease [Acidimicrobiia bacterium]